MNKKEKMSNKMTHNKFADKLAMRHPFMAVMGEYKNMNTPLRVRCTRKNEESDYLPGFLLSKHSCQQCVEERKKDAASRQ